jgi:hypothetical protein
MTRRTLALTLSLLAVAAVPAAAHDEAKGKIDPTLLLNLTAPKAADPTKAFDEAIKREPPANPNVQWKQQPDGSYRYGNTTIFIRDDCPPGEGLGPPPLPGRRR